MQTTTDRRDFLKLAAGLGLSFAAPGMDLRAADQRGTERKKSLMIVWLEGGPSQLETWDPHPNGPIGGPTRAITTSEQRRLKNLDIVSDAYSKGRASAFERTLYCESLDAAVRMMTSEQLKSFDIAAEPEAMRASYGNSQVGRACLIGRRLIEQGVRVVEVTQLNYNTHEDNFNKHRSLVGDLDPALSALVRDLADRHLLESIVLLYLGEFGRMPRINPKDGRDHWPSGFSSLVGGGGLARSVVLGATDPTSSRKVPDDPIQIPDLYATVLQTLGIDFAQQVITPISRPIRLSDGKSIERLLE